MASEFYVDLSPEAAVRLVDDAIVGGSITGERIDYHAVSGERGALCIVVVYEKHYYRAGNRLTLTLVVDNLSGRTRVHTIGGGGGEGLFRFDWGASESFEDAARQALRHAIL